VVEVMILARIPRGWRVWLARRLCALADRITTSLERLR
jgi:hypothetical protein